MMLQRAVILVQEMSVFCVSGTHTAACPFVCSNCGWNIYIPSLPLQEGDKPSSSKYGISISAMTHALNRQTVCQPLKLILCLPDGSSDVCVTNVGFWSKLKETGLLQIITAICQTLWLLPWQFVSLPIQAWNLSKPGVSHLVCRSNVNLTLHFIWLCHWSCSNYRMWAVSLPNFF